MLTVSQIKKAMELSYLRTSSDDTRRRIQMIGRTVRNAPLQEEVETYKRDKKTKL